MDTQKANELQDKEGSDMRQSYQSVDQDQIDQERIQGYLAAQTPVYAAAPNAGDANMANMHTPTKLIITTELDRHQTQIVNRDNFALRQDELRSSLQHPNLLTPQAEFGHSHAHGLDQSQGN